MGESYLPENLKPSEVTGAYLPEGVKSPGEGENVKIISHPQPRVYSDEDRRMDALKVSIEAHPGNVAEKIVASARLYEAYLKGETSDAQVS